jgi:hypothetical protein
MKGKRIIEDIYPKYLLATRVKEPIFITKVKDVKEEKFLKDSVKESKGKSEYVEIEFQSIKNIRRQILLIELGY